MTRVVFKIRYKLVYESGMIIFGDSYGFNDTIDVMAQRLKQRYFAKYGYEPAINVLSYVQNKNQFYGKFFSVQY